MVYYIGTTHIETNLTENEINKEHKRTLYIPLTLINNFMFCFISYSAFNELALV